MDHICSGKPQMFSEANPLRQVHAFSAPLQSHCECSRRPYNRQVTFESSSSSELPLPLILSPCRDQGAYFIGLQKYQTSLICTQGRSTKCHAHTSSPFILWVYAHRGMNKRTFKTPFCYYCMYTHTPTQPPQPPPQTSSIVENASRHEF